MTVKKGELLNAYIHIPFCSSICNYCDFTSFTGQEGKMTAYVEAVAKEIACSNLKDPFQTVYFGGGTPSLLPPGQLETILKALQEKAGFNPDIEISLEANPETVDLEKLKAYRSAGVNRLSLGAQASQEDLLKKLGRGHEWGSVVKAVASARKAGFNNLNLDLIFGLPGQTLAMFQETLWKALALNPEHLSLYALQVEEGTPLTRMVAEGLALPPEDLTADEYARGQEFLVREGFEQYEVSNFTRPGRACRHNWNIWRGEDYLGFGVSAVGTVGGVRHSHREDLMEYIRKVKAQEDVLELEVLSEQTREWERLILGLRTKDGVSKAEADRYTSRISSPQRARLNRLLKDGFLSLMDGRYKVTSRGYFVLNGILETLAA